MTKSQLIDRIAEKMSQAPRREVEAIVNAVFDSMLEALCRGERIEIRGFGSFAVKVRAPREGRNPKTGQKVSVPVRRALSFTGGKELRDRLNPDGAQAPANAIAPPDVPVRAPAAPAAEPLAAAADAGPRYTMS
jgi:integration host factor subunit beta